MRDVASVLVEEGEESKIKNVSPTVSDRTDAHSPILQITISGA